MAEPYIGTIALFAINFTPKNWLPCDGRTLDISKNAALYSVMGTRFGGDGKTTFALPNLQGRTPVTPSTNYGYVDGKTLGSATVAVTMNNLPTAGHTHNVNIDIANATVISATGKLLSTVVSTSTSMPPEAYGLPADVKDLVPQISTMIGPAGNGAAHNNMQPYLVMSYFIAVTGLYPPAPW